jgi:hypothetical protein
MGGARDGLGIRGGDADIDSSSRTNRLRRMPLHPPWRRRYRWPKAGLPPEKQRCGNCRFASEDVSTPQDVHAMHFCQRFPPLERDIIANEWFQPLVAELDWCGEWKPRR